MSDRASSKRAISRFAVPELAEIPEDLRERIEQVADRTGFVPNVFLALAHRPAELRAFLAYHDALMAAEGGLSPAEKEMIVVATSAANGCLYCTVAHGAVLRIRSKDPLLADQLAIDPAGADITARQRAMIDFALRLCREPATVGPADHDELRSHGFGDEDIWDIGAICALFAMSNRMAHLTAMRPNDEFYTLGRT